MQGQPASSLPSLHCETPSHLFESGRHFSQSLHVKYPSLQAHTGPPAVVLTASVVVTTGDPVVDATVVEVSGATVVVVVAMGLQKQQPSESVSIFMPAAHLSMVQ
jgi:hypothetical protein